MASRSLAQWLAYLEQLHPSAIDMGLDRGRHVAQRLRLNRPAPPLRIATGTYCSPQLGLLQNVVVSPARKPWA